jgi:hypothetical protein
MNNKDGYNTGTKDLNHKIEEETKASLEIVGFIKININNTTNKISIVSQLILC